MKVVDAVVDEEGGVRLLESVQLPVGQRVIVTIVDEDAPRTRSVSSLEGCIPYTGPPVSIEEMNAAIAEGGSGS